MSGDAGWDIVNPDDLGAPKGWSHGMLAPAGGRTLFVAGQVATGAHGEVVRPHASEPDDVAAQWERALENVLAVVRSAGGGPESIGRMTIYVTDRAAYLSARKPIGQAWRRAMGTHYPAIALVEVAGLVDEGAVVEIEATAVIADAQ